MVAVPPGQESADLAGLLYAIRPRRRQPGAAVPDARRGLAAELHAAPAAGGHRPWELQMAANVLGVFEVTVASYRIGGLRSHQQDRIVTQIHTSARIRPASRRVGPGSSCRLRPVPRSSMPVLYSVLACPRATPTVRTRTAALPGGYCVGLAPWSAADLPRWWRSSLRQYYPAPRPRARGRSPRRAAKDGAAPGWPGSQGRTGMRRWTRYGEAPAGGG